MVDFSGANEHLDDDDALLCSDAFEKVELLDDKEAWLLDFVTFSGRLASASRLRFVFALLGSTHSSGKRISAMDPQNTLAPFGNKLGPT